MSKHVQTFHLPSLKKKYSMHYRNVPSHVQTRYDKIWQVARCCVQQMLEYSPFWQLWLILLLQSTRARLASSASLLRWLFILCCSMSMDAPSRSPLASQFPRTAMRGHAGGFNSKGCSWSTWIVRCNEFVNPQSRDLQEPGIKRSFWVFQDTGLLHICPHSVWHLSGKVLQIVWWTCAQT